MSVFSLTFYLKNAVYVSIRSLNFFAFTDIDSKLFKKNQDFAALNLKVSLVI
jgi:hypothetical protein